MRHAWWVAAAVLVGCGGDGGGKDGTTDDFPRACDDSDVDGDCILYTGDGWEADDVTDNCPTGTLGAVCPGGALGVCTLEAGTEFETATSFYPGFYNQGDASANCSGAGGDWVPF